MDLGAKLFYKCQFNVEFQEPTPNDDLLWQIMLVIRSWIQHKRCHLFDNISSLTWAKNGTFLKEKDHDGREVSFKSGLFEDEDKIEWAGFLEESLPSVKDIEAGLQFAPRTWKTELSYRANSKQGPGIFSLILSYRDRPGFLGPNEQDPEPSVPRIVRLLTKNDRLFCSKSGLDLEQMQTIVSPAGEPDTINAVSFWNLVMKRDREYPIVYIAPDPNTGIPAIDPKELEAALYPNALICTPVDAQADAAIQQACQMPALRCDTDSVRIYATRPRLRGVDAFGDMRRHRYFSHQHIERLSKMMPEAGGDPLIALLRQALSQDVHFYETDDVISIEQIDEDKREAEYNKRLGNASRHIAEYQAKLQDLRNSMVAQRDEIANIAQGQRASESEENDVMALKKKLQEEAVLRHSHENDVKTAFALAEDAETQMEEMRKDNEDLNARIYSLKSTIQSLRRSNESGGDIEEIRQSLTTQLPDFFTTGNAQVSDTDKKISAFFGNVYSDRIIIADHAMQSLKQCITNPVLFWQSMIMICRPLWNAYTAGNGNIDDRFLSDQETLAGFTITLKEGSMTRNDSHLMGLRQINENGREYSIEPHLKKGNKDDADSIRIYYAWDEVEQKIVIGSIGKHIPNYTTKKGH